jgi:hypothetical protein
MKDDRVRTAAAGLPIFLFFEGKITLKLTYASQKLILSNQLFSKKLLVTMAVVSENVCCEGLRQKLQPAQTIDAETPDPVMPSLIRKSSHLRCQVSR